MSHPIRIRTQRAGVLRASALSAVSLAALLGCSEDVVNLGEDTKPRPTPPSYSRCVDSPTLAGDVIVNEQAELDALEGCQTIEGDVTVQPFFYPDLRPLHDLEVVGGALAFALIPKDEQSTEVYELADAVSNDWLGSFEGLEALQRVGSLTIWETTAPDLTGLSGLRELTGEGLLSVQGSNLRDLEPLARLQGIESLFVGGERLESIAALQLPPTLSALSVSGEQLTELGEIRSLRKVDTDLEIWQTQLRDMTAFSQLEWIGGYFSVSSVPALENLDGLESLTHAAQVVLMSNPLLQNLDGLTSLEYAEGLAINGNPRLPAVPNFQALGANLAALTISNNPALEEIGAFSGILASISSIAPDGTAHRIPFRVASQVNSRPDIINILNNPLLRNFSMPAGWPGGGYVAIHGNTSLETLGLSEFEAIAVLSIEENAALRSVDLDALRTVDLLSVLDNPLLTPSTFDSVQTFERKVAGNAGQPPATQADYQ